MLQVRELDHIVIRSSDVERSVAWYRDVLGLEAEQLDEWREGKAFFPSVRVNADTIIDIIGFSDRDGVNVDHFCLVVEPVDLEELARSGTFTVVDGPGPRSGARGQGTSLYVLDPDGNTVELRHYG